MMGPAVSELGWLRQWWPVIVVVVLGIIAGSITQVRVEANAEDIKAIELGVEENAEDIDTLKDELRDKNNQIQLQLRDVQHKLQLQSRATEQQDQKLNAILDAVVGN